jgi:hypothetical protein
MIAREVWWNIWGKEDSEYLNHGVASQVLCENQQWWVSQSAENGSQHMFHFRAWLHMTLCVSSNLWRSGCVRAHLHLSWGKWHHPQYRCDNPWSQCCWRIRCQCHRYLACWNHRKCSDHVWRPYLNSEYANCKDPQHGSQSLEQPPHWCTVQRNFEWRKVKTCQFGSTKWFWAQHFFTRCWGWQKAQQRLRPAVDWLDGLIGPGELLVVVSHILQSQFQFYGWGWGKKKLILDVRNTVTEPHTEQGWRCS